MLICQICKTQREIGNGRMEPAERRGYVHHFGQCPTCQTGTWTEAFAYRPMTAEDIREALQES